MSTAPRPSPSNKRLRSQAANKGGETASYPLRRTLPSRKIDALSRISTEVGVRSPNPAILIRMPSRTQAT